MKIRLGLFRTPIFEFIFALGLRSCLQLDSNARPLNPLIMRPINYRFTRAESNLTVFVMGHSRPLYPLFLYFLYIDSKSMFFKIFWWLDSNHGPLLSEVTALPTEPQRLHNLTVFVSLLWNVVYEMSSHHDSVII